MPARPRTRSPIRWDRLGRVFLLSVLVAIMFMYVSPLSRWVTQSRTASEDRAELHRLERQNNDLKQRLKALKQPETLELQARRLGMVKQGERAFVIENLPR